MATLSRILAFLLATAGVSFAQGTHQWSESGPADWEKGIAEAVSIGSDGTLTQGFALKPVADLQAADLWAAATDKAGNTYLATGSPAQVVRVAPDGAQTVIFKTKDLSVQALAAGPDGVVYAAALPSAKVYALDPGKTADETTAKVVFDPTQTDAKPKYIWAMSFDGSGRLLLASGAPGAVFRVAPGAKPELVYESDEPHIRTLLIKPDGELLAGSDGTGLVYRIDPSGRAFVIYEAGKREITSLALGPAGQLYVAAVGDKGRAGTIPALPLGGAPQPQQGNATVTITVVQPGTAQSVASNAAVPGGSELDLIPANPSEAPRRIWSTGDEVVYALSETPAGLLAATGNHGRVYRLHDDGTVEDIAHTGAGEVIGFTDAPGGAVLLPTANPGKLLRMGLQPAAQGTLTSEVFDASEPAEWGRAEVTGSGFTLQTRTGNVDNPARGWAEWKAVKPGESTGQPGARFAQWRLMLAPGARVSQVGLNYLPANAAPVVDEILVAPGTRVNAAANQPSIPQQVQLTFASQSGGAVNIDQNSPQAPLGGIKDKTGITLRWAAHDDNGDDLTFAVYARGESETSWRLIKDGITDRFYSFDAAQLPDGPWRVRVVASDKPSHPVSAALTGERVSDLFLVATGAPTVAPLQARAEGAALHVTATATSVQTPIAHAEYSLDSAPWQYVEPVGRLSDAPREQYDFRIPAGAGPHTLTLRVWDRFDNTGSAKTSTP